MNCEQLDLFETHEQSLDRKYMELKVSFEKLRKAFWGTNAEMEKICQNMHDRLEKIEKRQL